MTISFTKLILAFVLLGFSFSLHAKEISITVKGMVCGFCAQGIEKKFKALPEVENVEVSLEKKIVKVMPKKDKDVPDSKINAILKEAGYNIEEIKR